MTIEESIKLYESNAEYERTHGRLQRYLDFGQLAEWLTDYKRLKEREACGDCISRSSIKQKLQEHHDFFVNAYGGFSNLPQNDKARVDEITNCIAMVVNEPPVNPQKTGHWIAVENDEMETVGYYCSECDLPMETEYQTKFCPNCGAKMEVGNG